MRESKAVHNNGKSKKKKGTKSKNAKGLPSHTVSVSKEPETDCLGEESDEALENELDENKHDTD